MKEKNIPCSIQNLKFDGEHLNSDKTISYYNIQSNSKLKLFKRDNVIFVKKFDRFNNNNAFLPL